MANREVRIDLNFTASNKYKPNMYTLNMYTYQSDGKNGYTPLNIDMPVDLGTEAIATSLIAAAEIFKQLVMQSIRNEQREKELEQFLNPPKGEGQDVPLDIFSQELEIPGNPQPLKESSQETYF